MQVKSIISYLEYSLAGINFVQVSRYHADCKFRLSLLILFLNLIIRYALPLFFLCVRSNVGYIVVAVYIPENEDSGSISEVLQIIRNENPQWNPRNMMVDFSLAEITAIEECFPSKEYH